MYIWLNTILQGGVLTPETPPLAYAYDCKCRANNKKRAYSDSGGHTKDRATFQVFCCQI